MNHKRGKPRKQVKCTLCTPSRYGNRKQRTRGKPHWADGITKSERARKALDELVKATEK